MNKSNTLERAKRFIYENGKLFDRRRFEYHFEGGSSESVITALRSYQNADGGFGNALEPDIRCPQSQTVPTEMALAIMDEVNAFDSQILEGIESYLGEVTLEQGGVPLVLRSVNDYPHAPWWTTETDHLPSINPTGGIVGLLYKQKVRTEILDSVSFVKSEIICGKRSKKGSHLVFMMASIGSRFCRILLNRSGQICIGLP